MFSCNYYQNLIEMLDDFLVRNYLIEVLQKVQKLFWLTKLIPFQS